MALHISIAAEKIGEVAGMPVTNSLLATWVVMGFLVLLAILVTRKFKKVPKYPQLMVELVVGGLYDFFSTILGHNIKKVFPLTASLFIFILVANWAGLIPGVGTVGYWERVEHVVVAQEVEEVPQESAPTFPVGSWEYWLTGKGGPTEFKLLPVLRGPTADINTTLALALITMIYVQVFGFAHVGLGYLSKFFNFKNPIFTFVGVLELISELSRIISFAFRLFGNIFAGEVLLAVMAFLFAFGLPMPFIALEIFVGVIQALVFSMLAAVFISLAAVGHQEAH